MTPQLRGLMQAVFAVGRHDIDAGGEVMPTFLGETSTGERLLVVSPWQNEDDKLMHLAKVRAIFAASGVVRYALMTEAWSVIEDRRDPRTPSDRPDRKEILSIVGAEPGCAAGFSATITTGPGGRRCGQEEWFSDVSGRMVSLLPSQLMN